MEPYSVLNSKEIYNGRVTRLTVDEITLPNGRTAFRETVHNPDSVAILALDDDGLVYLVRQYRHSVPGMTLEIPAGILDEGEPPEECAFRELEEEIGFKAGKLTKICSFHSSIGVCAGTVHLFLASELSQGTMALDDDEFITVEKYSLEDCERMIKTGEIFDCKTVLAIYAYKTLI